MSGKFYGSLSCLGACDRTLLVNNCMLDSSTIVNCEKKMTGIFFFNLSVFLTVIAITIGGLVAFFLSRRLDKKQKD